MKNSKAGFYLLCALFFLSAFVLSCENKSKEVRLTRVYPDSQDGILAIQKMEFEQTKDPALGYVPKDRLIRATNDWMVAKLSGRIESIGALAWTERGPNTDAVGPSNGNFRTPGAVTSGRMRAILVDNADATGNTVWVGGVDGGLWKTTNVNGSPATWTLINDFFGNLAITSICQDPTDPLIMYFGTGEKTFNADAVRGGGVWRSADGGATWTLLGATTTFFNVSKVLCDGAGNIYISTVNPTLLTLGAGLYRSTKASAGAVWSNIAPSGMSSFISDFEISSTGRMHINAGQSQGAGDLPICGYRYTNTPSTVAPGTWTTATTPYPASTEGCELACSGNVLYALRVSGDEVPVIYKSINGGDTWAATGTTPPFTSGQAWYCLGVDINPADNTQVIVGSLDNYKSINGGATWTQISDWVCFCGTGRYIHADEQIIKWYSGNRVLFGTDGGLFYSPDGGATVADKNVGLRLKQFYSCAIHPTSTNYFLAGAQDNGVHQLNGAGLTGSVEVTGGDGAFVHIDEDQPAFQWGSFIRNTYRRSINSGASWNTPVSDGNGSFINPTDYDDINNIMYCGRNVNEYNRWSNAQTGGTLTTVAMATLAGGVVSHVKVSPYTTNRVYFGGSTGKIVRADNANATPAFTDITGSTMPAANVSCVAMGTNDNNLLATFSNYGVGHVWFSSTGGGAAAWTNITGDLPDIPVRWAMFNPEDNDQAIIATEMGIYETTNINGVSTNWVRNATFPVVKTNMLQYRFSDNTILAATHGRGLWTSPFVPTNAYVRFASSYTYSSVKTEATGATTGCRNYTDYTLNMHIDRAPVGAANVTLSIAGGATATLGVDYDFTTNGNFVAPSSVVTFPNASTVDQPITIRVYNDAELDAFALESFTFNYSIGGGTDAIAAPSSSSYTFYINESDAVPVSVSNPIATAAATTRIEHLGNNGTYYFYSGTNIINRISGASLSLGCVTSSIFEAGNVWQSFFGGGQRSQKVFDIAPTTNPGATYTVGLYFTAAELTGEVASTLRIAKTTAATMAAANSGNTIIMVTPAPVAYGTGWIYTVTFTGFSKFFLVDAGAALPVSLLNFSGRLENGKIPLDWSTSSEQNSKRFQIEKSADGNSFYAIGSVPAATNSSSQRNYSFVDKQANEFNYYRLKMEDIDGRYTYSPLILVKNANAVQDVNVVNNPFSSYIDVRFAKIPKQPILMELVNLSGALVYRKEYGPMDRVRFELSGLNVSSGPYILRTSLDGKRYVNKLVKQ